MSDVNFVDPELLAQFQNPDWGAERLASISLFRAFDDETRKKIYSIGEVQALKKGNHAVIEGEPTRGLYLILMGNLSVHKNDSVTGTAHRLASMEEGDSFGELSLFDNAPRSATVRADSYSFVFNLDAERFEGFLQQAGPELSSSFYKTCAVMMSERVRSLNSEYITSQQLLWKYALRKDEGQVS